MLTCLRAADDSILRTDVSGLFGGKISFLRLSARYGYAALTPPNGELQDRGRGTGADQWANLVPCPLPTKRNMVLRQTWEGPKRCMA